MTTPRYTIEIKVREVDAEGIVRDTYSEYATRLAIADVQEADLMAHMRIGGINGMFAARADASPVTVEDGDDA